MYELRRSGGSSRGDALHDSFQLLEAPLGISQLGSLGPHISRQRGHGLQRPSGLLAAARHDCNMLLAKVLLINSGL